MVASAYCRVENPTSSMIENSRIDVLRVPWQLLTRESLHQGLACGTQSCPGHWKAPNPVVFDVNCGRMEEQKLGINLL